MVAKHAIAKDGIYNFDETFPIDGRGYISHDQNIRGTLKANFQPDNRE